jgi:ABC-type antimicrobial peptide transport system permease subunit
LPLLSGDSRTALTAPNTVIINQTTAKKYFGDANPVGQTLIFDNADVYKVTGVFADMPDNSHFHFDFISALAGSEESKNTLWISNNFSTYLLLKAGADAAALEKKFPAMIEEYMAPTVQQILGASLKEFREKGNDANYYLQPLRNIHLHSDLGVEFEPNGSIKYVYIFSAIAFFILLIACINFMNLSTARSANRAKEVGIRKVVGSYRRQLIGQFLAESIFLSVIALLCAVVLVELILPAFNNLAEKNLQTIDYDYLKTLGIQIAAGRDFSEALGGDSTGVILNESAAKKYGFADPIGKRIYRFGFTPDRSVDPNNVETFTIVGVVKDFHYASLRQNLGALGFLLRRSRSFISFRFKAEEVSSVISFLKNKLVFVANLLAWPVAYFAMNKWLQDFAYRLNLSWWMFALAGALALLIALLTVSFQAIKAALANPVEALRYE